MSEAMIQATFLGGASCVGASCTLLDIGGQRLLVDCGIRMGQGEAGQLPDLSHLNEARPAAVILTHAHMDHSGALPLLLAGMPGVPVYCTPPTAALLRILYDDALRIMESREESDIPLYAPPMVEETLNRIVQVPFEHEVAVADGSVRLTFHPAGHILGAGLAVLQGPAGRVLVTGDFAVESQQAVGAAAIPRGPFDLVITESTYGARFHPNRRDQEQKLAETVAATVGAGGFVLIPAFAIGRAQEVLLILARAMEKGAIPTFPVYADGMVTRVCTLYRDFPHDVSQSLAKRIAREAHPFFSAEGPVRAVSSPKERAAILKGPPAAIVASSGMLSGGPSVGYATELAGGAGNLIAITGYQDEEAPGRRLLELTEQPPEARVLPLGNRRVTVACAVSTYGLSAHADGRQIARFVATVRPRAVALVHGDEQAREDLWGLIRASVPDLPVHLPQHGETISVAGHPRSGSRGARERSTPPPRPGLGGGRRPEGIPDLVLLHEHLLTHARPGRPFTARELYDLFCGDLPFELEDFDHFRGLLTSARHLFQAHRDRPFLFRPRRPDLDGPQATVASPFMEQNAALEAARNAFPPEARLLKVGRRAEQTPPVLVLTFAFPETAATRWAEAIEGLARLTGHEIEICPETAQNLLSELLLVLAQNVKLSKMSFHRERKALAVKVATAEDLARLTNVAEAFQTETGFTLEPSRREAPPMPVSAVLKHDHQTGRLEINAAFACIVSAFTDQEVTLFKKSRKVVGGEEYIELGFMTPAAGERCRDLIDRLAHDTGWPMRIAPSVNQQALLQEALALVRPHSEPVGNPSYRPPDTVAIKITAPIAADVATELKTAFQQRTGLNLVLISV